MSPPLETLSRTDRESLPALARSRDMHPNTLLYRLRSGMRLDEALECPVEHRSPRALQFRKGALSLASRRLSEVRRSVDGCRRRLERWPRDVKANAQMDRLLGELAFLENLLEPIASSSSAE